MASIMFPNGRWRRLFSGNTRKIRVRALQTELVENMLQDLEDTSKAFSGPSIQASWLQGDIGVGVLPAGEVSGLVKGIPSVKELVNEMISG